MEVSPRCSRCTTHGHGRQGAQTIGVGGRQVAGDGGAPVVADDVRGGGAEVVQHADDVVDQERQPVFLDPPAVRPSSAQRGSVLALRGHETDRVLRGSRRVPGS